LGLDATTNIGTPLARQTRAKAPGAAALDFIFLERRSPARHEAAGKHRTSNIERPTSNEWFEGNNWKFDVECWMFIGNTPGRTSLRSEASAFSRIAGFVETSRRGRDRRSVFAVSNHFHFPFAFLAARCGFVLLLVLVLGFYESFRGRRTRTRMRRIAGNV
jgi:hypothetical protein